MRTALPASAGLPRISVGTGTLAVLIATIGARMRKYWLQLGPGEATWGPQNDVPLRLVKAPHVNEAGQHCDDRKASRSGQLKHGEKPLPASDSKESHRNCHREAGNPLTHARITLAVSQTPVCHSRSFRGTCLGGSACTSL